jgi:TPR repeat protein
VYQDGQGAKQDLKEAVKLFRKAADQGNAKAQSVLGTMYTEGQGAKQDLKKAVKWFQRAADQGHAYAQINLDIVLNHYLGRRTFRRSQKLKQLKQGTVR